MKEYDVFLKKQPEGDIIVYMLRYYANFSVRNGLLIDVNAHEKTLKKLSVNNHLCLHTSVSGTKKTASERVQDVIGITASPNISARKYVEYIEPDIINITIPEIDIIPTVPLTGIDNGIEILSSLSELKSSVEKFSEGIHIQADISETAKVGFEQVDDGIVLTPVVNDLLYRDPHFNGASGIELAASVSAAITRYRLLVEVDNNCILDDEPSYTVPSDLSDIDNMTLEELDYVTLED